jgi:hypothetical protein
MRRAPLLALMAATLAAPAAAQDPSPRFGVWKIQSDNPPPSINIMTYEPHGNGGMKITVWSMNSEGESNEWGYTTMFDGEFEPVSGQENAATAVEFVDARTTKISNKRGGRVTQEIINVLSDDGNTINNEYIRIAEDGSRRSSHAVYERVMTDPSQFIGTWELVSVERQTDPNVWVPAETWSNPVGYIYYDADGNMGGQLTNDPPPPESTEVVGGFVSYFGHYQVNLTNGSVSHHRIGHLDRDQVGTTVTRYAEFNGDILTLTLAPDRALRLNWRRISGGSP